MNINLDNRSDISPLQCGSIRPNPKYNPVFDPQNQTFVPPTEITIRIKQPVPDWRSLDCREPVESVYHSPNRALGCDDDSYRSQIGALIVVDERQVILSPPGNERCFRADTDIREDSAVEQSLLYSSPSEEPLSDGERQISGRLQITPRLYLHINSCSMRARAHEIAKESASARRKSLLVRNDLKHFTKKVTLPFKRKTSGNLGFSTLGWLA